LRLVLPVVLVACLLVPAAPASARASAEVQMVRKANSFRKRHGLRPVRISRSLMRSSEGYAWHQMRNGFFGHSSRIHASGRFRRLGEILEYHGGTRARIRQAFRSWLHSPGHRAIIMDRGFRYVGAGRASGRFRGGRATIWVMHFGSR
jgi:uncharacterized protein YkwD